jgi:lipopolysaccharide export system permease protein
MMAIAFAALGDPRTTRQGRGLAIAGAVVAVVVLRIAGFAASSAAVRSHAAVPIIYAVPVGAIVVSLVMVLQSGVIRSIQAKLRGAGRAAPPSPTPNTQKA